MFYVMEALLHVFTATFATETLYVGSFIVTLLICDNTFFLISLFKMRHVIFSLNEYVMLCYVMC